MNVFAHTHSTEMYVCRHARILTLLHIHTCMQHGAAVAKEQARQSGKVCTLHISKTWRNNLLWYPHTHSYTVHLQRNMYVHTNMISAVPHTCIQTWTLQCHTHAYKLDQCNATHMHTSMISAMPHTCTLTRILYMHIEAWAIMPMHACIQTHIQMHTVTYKYRHTYACQTYIRIIFVPVLANSTI
jgi:hypothetical protein